MKSRPMILLLLAAGILSLTGCANQPPHTASGQELKLETIQRPNRQPTYQFREVDR